MDTNRLRELAGIPLMESEIENQAEAERLYDEQRKQFHAALSQGNVKEARRLAQEFDWPTDGENNELWSWYTETTGYFS